MVQPVWERCIQSIVLRFANEHIFSFQISTKEKHPEERKNNFTLHCAGTWNYTQSLISQYIFVAFNTWLRNTKTSFAEFYTVVNLTLLSFSSLLYLLSLLSLFVLCFLSEFVVEFVLCRDQTSVLFCSILIFYDKGRVRSRNRSLSTHDLKKSAKQKSS